jgi:hypothetical protein
MSFTLAFASVSILGTLAVFAVRLKKRGWKSAAIGAGVTLVISAVGFVAALQVILRTMNN